MIFLDLSIFSLQTIGGISVVWGEYLKRFPSYINPNDLTLCIPETDNYILKELNLPLASVKKVGVRGVISKYLPYFLQGAKNDLLHMSYYGEYPYFKGKKIVTVHDFTHELFGSLSQRLFHNRLKYRCLKQADVILCISHSTKADLLKIYPQFSKKNIHITHNAASKDYYPDKGCITRKTPLPYFLWVGHRGGYKNFSAALDFLKITKDIDQKLVLAVVGFPFNDKEKSEIADYGLTDSVINLGIISLPELRKQYSDAFALLYLSKYEGFGLPILEAQQCSCPVICENIPSSKEVGADSVIVIEKYQKKEILRIITQLKDETSRIALQVKGENNTRRFDWDKTVENIAHIYKEIR
jgi:mannosyltransferase